MCPCLFLTIAPLLPLHRKSGWTMLVDNVRLEICLLGTSNSMVTVTFFPWCNPKWSRVRIRRAVCYSITFLNVTCTLIDIWFGED